MQSRAFVVLFEDLAHSLVVGLDEFFQFKKGLVELDESFEGLFGRLEAHLGGQLATADLVSEPDEPRSCILTRPLATVELCLTLKDGRFDPEREDVAPTIKICAALGSGYLADAVSQRLDLLLELVALSLFECLKGCHCLREHVEEVGVFGQRNIDHSLSRAIRCGCGLEWLRRRPGRRRRISFIRDEDWKRGIWKGQVRRQVADPTVHP